MDPAGGVPRGSLPMPPRRKRNRTGGEPERPPADPTAGDELWWHTGESPPLGIPDPGYPCPGPGSICLLSGIPLWRPPDPSRPRLWALRAGEEAWYAEVLAHWTKPTLEKDTDDGAPSRGRWSHVHAPLRVSSAILRTRQT